MRIITYQEIRQLRPVLPARRKKPVIFYQIDLPGWQNELVAVIGSKQAGEAFLKKAQACGSPGHAAGAPAQANLVTGLTLFGHLYQVICRESPQLAETRRSELTDAYLTAAYLQPYRTHLIEEVSLTAWKQLLLALIFARQQQVMILPDIFAGAGAPEKALLQRAIHNLRALQPKPRTIFFHTRQPEEAILLADRIVVLAPGAACRIGEVIPVFFQEPRSHSRLSQLPAYGALRRRLRYLLTDALALEDQVSFSMLQSLS